MDFDTELDFDLDELDDDTLDDSAVDFMSDDDIQTTRNLPRPIRHTVAARKRQYINGLKKQALNELVQELPAPDTDLYILSNGSGGTYRVLGKPVAFEFGHFIPVLIEMMNLKAGHLYISTWTMNRAHSLNILQTVDSGQVAHLAVMTDPYFLRREAAVANGLVMGIMQRKQRFVAFKNHVKAIAIANADETKSVVVTGSANLSSQPRAENFVVSCDLSLYQWLRDEFFEAMLNA